MKNENIKDMHFSTINVSLINIQDNHVFNLVGEFMALNLSLFKKFPLIKKIQDYLHAFVSVLPSRAGRST